MEETAPSPSPDTELRTSGRAFRLGERIQLSTVQHTERVPFASWATAPGWLLM